jgi:flagellar biosynthesis protein FliQ
MDPELKAIEEWKLLQGIVDRKEKIVFQLRGYCYLLVAVLGAAIFHARSQFSEWTLLYIAYLVVIAFFAIEVGQRIALRRAIDRSRRIERLLREGLGYDGPVLGDALGARVTLREVWRCAACNEMVWVPAIIALIAITVFAVHRWW